MCQEGLASTCHFAVDRTWQSQLRSDRLAGPTLADTGREGGGARREEWQHRCIIHLFIIPRYSPLITPSPQKTSLPSLFLSSQMSSVGAWLRWCGRERRHFHPEFRFPSLLPVFIYLFIYFINFFLGGANEHTKNTDKVRGQEVGSCSALSHRYRECVTVRNLWAVRVKFKGTAQWWCKFTR